MSYSGIYLVLDFLRSWSYWLCGGCKIERKVERQKLVDSASRPPADGHWNTSTTHVSDG